MDEKFPVAEISLAEPNRLYKDTADIPFGDMSLTADFWFLLFVSYATGIIFSRASNLYFIFLNIRDLPVDRCFSHLQQQIVRTAEWLAAEETVVRR